MLYSDLHVHTRYCHGKGEPIDFVREALARGAVSIGLLGHSRCVMETGYSMKPEDQNTLYALTTQMKDAYQGQIDLFRGIELDYFSLPQDLQYDYSIGSVHYIQQGAAYISIDSSREELETAIVDQFDGDPRELVKEYYRTVSDVLNRTGADIVGHFDLITKFNEQAPVFDDRDPVCRQAALDAMEALAARDPLFEINTGAISRGYRTTPYPAKWQLEALREMGGRILFSSDAHQPRHMFYLFDDSAALASRCGFTTAWRLTPEGFQEYAL